MIVRALLLSWMAAGCAPKEAPEGETDTEVVDTDVAVDTDEPAAPMVSASFTPATVAAGERADLGVTIENFTVIDPRSSPPVAEGEGHFHVYLDGFLVVAAWTPTVPIQTAAAAAPGDYVYTVVLVDSGHNEIVPAVTAEATLTVQ